ncbi:EamA family transporter [Gammaproteobacteria bacterium 45_16_T64]|nr:EamA family transporter [Gammaproteobacteria bacterium 45_16_T64]
MLGALLSFSLMAIGARELSQQINIFQTLFFRSVVGLVVVSLLIARTQQFSLISTQRFGVHLIRNLFHFVGQYGWFVGISLLPLAQVFALEFTVPLWTVIVASIFIGERITARKVIAIGCGLLGVAIILRPDVATISMGSLIVIGAAMSYSVAYVAMKSLSDTEDILTILFYMSVIQTPICLVFMLGNWVMPSIIQWVWLSIIGLTGLSAHYCIASAMRISDAGIVVTLDFLRLPLIMVVGVLFYQEGFNVGLIVGATLMLIGNVINIRQPNKADVEQ